MLMLVGTVILKRKHKEGFMKAIQYSRATSITAAGAIVAALALSVLAASSAQAATLSSAFVRFDRMKVGTATTGTVCAKPATAGTEADVLVSFPTGYTLGVAGTFTVNTTNTEWPTGGTVWPGIGTATNVTGQDVTFPSTDLVVGTLYCFNWTSSAAVAVTGTPSASNQGTITLRASGPSVIDSGIFTTASINDDQIVVTATVPQTFSFALSANADAFATALSPGSVVSSATPRTATVNTNAKSGWTVWAKDSNAGLNSASAAKLIASRTPGTNSTLTNGAEGYNTGITQSQVGGSGTITVAAPFVGGGFSGGGLDTSLRTLATSTGTADTAVLTIKNNASISAITPAATDYTDTITVVAAGLF
jgi:hypothetical protein